MSVRILDSGGQPVPASQIAAVRRAAYAGDRPYRAASARDQAVANWWPGAVSADFAGLIDRERVVARVRARGRNKVIARAAGNNPAALVVG
ncbi:MAG: hypothetical protein VX394_06810, partial [Pseudomonadota bacterium]|nr:hypothetical protein [Pseudomonadota bacterium]